MAGLLWLMRQYTDLLRDVARAGHEGGVAGGVAREAGCVPVRLWVVRSSHTTHCGE